MDMETILHKNLIPSISTPIYATCFVAHNSVPTLGHRRSCALKPHEPKRSTLQLQIEALKRTLDIPGVPHIGGLYSAHECPEVVKKQKVEEAAGDAAGEEEAATEEAPTAAPEAWTWLSRARTPKPDQLSLEFSGLCRCCGGSVCFAELQRACSAELLLHTSVTAAAA